MTDAASRPSETGSMKGRRAVVTGASSGIGEATSRALAAIGFEVVLGARRVERIERIAAEIGGVAVALDVTDPASVAAFADAATSSGVLHVLVNNAGGARGVAPISAMDEDHWRWMWETNVLGLARMTKALLPALEASGDGHIVSIGSIAGIETYENGAGYSSTKHAVRAITDTLRLELLGKPVRVTEIDPGLVETEFSIVRFDGDTERAAKVYEGMTPLVARDIADLVAFAVSRPSHVNIDQMVVRPRDQARATRIARR